MRLFDRRGQPIKKRWKHPARRFSQQRLDGARPGMVYVDPRYFDEQYGWPGGPEAALLNLNAMSKGELKDFLDAHGVSYGAGLTKSELLTLAQTV